MEVSIKSQLLATLYAIIFGVFLGFIYDFVRCARILIVGSYDFKNKSNFLLKKLSKTKIINENKRALSLKAEGIVIFIADILYFLIISPFVAIFIYATSSGIVRWYLLFGFGIGMTIYFLTIRRLIKPVYEALIILIRLLFECFKYPFKFALNRLKAILGKRKEKRKSKIKRKTVKKDERQVLLYIGKEKSPDSK